MDDTRDRSAVDEEGPDAGRGAPAPAWALEVGASCGIDETELRLALASTLGLEHAAERIRELDRWRRAELLPGGPLTWAEVLRWDDAGLWEQPDPGALLAVWHLWLGPTASPWCAAQIDIFEARSTFLSCTAPTRSVSGTSRRRCVSGSPGSRNRWVLTGSPCGTGGGQFPSVDGD